VLQAARNTAQLSALVDAVRVSQKGMVLCDVPSLLVR
jgi:hypothetical protein